MSLANIEDVEQRLPTIGDELNDNEIQDRLDSANRRLLSKVGRRFIDAVRAEKDDQEDFDLAFDSLESFDRILFLDDEVDTSNYTENLDNGTVSFTTSYAEDNIAEHLEVFFYYVPTVFKDIEIKLAVKDILRFESVQTGSDSVNSRVEGLENDIQALVSEVNRMAPNYNALDHQPRFRVRTDQIQ